MVLDDLSLEVGEHEVVALIGASGSGKSTLLRCVNLLTEVDDGVIRLDGRDITDPRADADQVRQQIGLVFQSFNLFPHMTVLQNITLAPRTRAQAPAGRSAGAGDAVVVPDRPGRQGGQLPRPALRRPAAAGGDRPGPGQQPRACCCSTR